MHLLELDLGKGLWQFFIKKVGQCENYNSFCRLDEQLFLYGLNFNKNLFRKKREYVSGIIKMRVNVRKLNKPKTTHVM